LDDGFIARQASQLITKPNPYALDAWLNDNFDVTTLAARSEAQLEDAFIGPLLAQLGWRKVAQETLTV